MWLRATGAVSHMGVPGGPRPRQTTIPRHKAPHPAPPSARRGPWATNRGVSHKAGEGTSRARSDLGRMTRLFKYYTYKKTRMRSMDTCSNNRKGRGEQIGSMKKQERIIRHLQQKSSFIKYLLFDPAASEPSLSALRTRPCSLCVFSSRGVFSSTPFGKFLINEDLHLKGLLRLGKCFIKKYMFATECRAV